MCRKQYGIIMCAQEKVYPFNSTLQESKLECYPDKQTYQVTCNESKLQNLMYDTVKYLLKYLLMCLIMSE